MTVTPDEWAERLNPLEYVDNPAELEVQRELHSLGVENDPYPEGGCPTCGGELTVGGGMVGETIPWCEEPECAERVVWCDDEGAIRSVL